MRNWPFLKAQMQSRGTPVRFSPENADELTLLAMARELGIRSLPTAVYTLHSTSLYSLGNPYSAGAGEAANLRQRSLEFMKCAIDAKLLEPSTCEQIFAMATQNRS